MSFSFKIIVFIYDRKNSYLATIVIDLFESIDCIISLKEVFNDYFVAMFTKHAFFDWKLNLNWNILAKKLFLRFKTLKWVKLFLKV